MLTNYKAIYLNGKAKVSEVSTTNIKVARTVYLKLAITRASNALFNPGGHGSRL
jgi:hypothetical protein